MASQPPTNPFSIPDPSTLLSNVTDAIPGAGFILDVVKAVGDLPALLTTLIQEVENAHPLDWVTVLAAHLGSIKDSIDISNLPVGVQLQSGQSVPTVGEAAGSLASSLQNLQGGSAPPDLTVGIGGPPAGTSGGGVGQIGSTQGEIAGKTWKWFSQHVVGQFYTDMLEMGLGVDTSKFDAEAKRGVQTVDTMLGFTFALQFIMAAAETFGAGLFAGRWGHVLKETVAKIPEEMGLSWALGLTIDEAFKVAVGRSVEEGINRQKRGNRIAWQQLRPMLKQHVIGADTLTELLKNQGFPDEQIEWLNKLRDVQLPIGDLQQMYLQEIMTGTEVKNYISELGFAADDVDRIFTLYVDKAETTAGAELRTTARQLFTNQLIAEDQYRTILTDSNFPKREIDGDIRAINLVHDVGRVQQSVTLIKSRYLHKLIPAETAIADLRTLNYSLQYASDLVSSWDLPPIHPKHGLNQSKLLSYFISGLLSESQVRDGLAALSVDSKTIDFLVANPSSANGARVLRLGPNMVLQAYVEGAVTDQQLPAMFRKVGVAPDDVTLWIDKAVYRKSHTKGTTTYTTHLSAGEIISCFKYGIFDENTAHERLMQLGYSPDDATLKLEIENKGVFQPPVPPVFATLGAAIEYLREGGYGIIPPTDPKVLAAETMLAMAGYSWTMPSTTLPGGGLTGSGSGGLIDPITGLPIPPGTGTPPPGPVQPPI